MFLFIARFRIHPLTQSWSNAERVRATYFPQMPGRDSDSVYNSDAWPLSFQE
jgi:hypothetical protein